MPKVSVIVPCRDEEKTIQLLLAAIYNQSFPTNQMEVVIADGHSEDQTRQVIAVFQSAHPELAITVVDNTARTIPAALNTAIQHAAGEIIVRLDAHSVPQPDYVQRCVKNLEEGKGKNVGGVWQIEAGADTWIARSIALAAAHPLGVGDAKYRYTETPEAVDTVPFGAYYRKLVDEIGGFDETLLANEDYEFNVRVRQSGGVVWLDPHIKATYFARPTLGDLAKQYWRYGYWKVRMLRRYPETLRWRQALPPLFVSSILVLVLLSIVWPQARLILGLEVVSYALALFLVGLQAALTQKSLTHLIGVPIAIATMHFFWGCAFLWSLIKR
jgi:glycosyltransferase involved in cell wall biosynthesis